MASPTRGLPRLLGMVVVAVLSSQIAALDLNLCAKFNTADSAATVDDLQSNGLCHDNCIKRGFAYAITQYKSCWCSDYAPAQSIGLSSCNTPCPSYPFESCGGPNLFGYISLGKDPSGTRGAGDSQPSSTESSDTSSTASSTSSSSSPPSSTTESSTTTTDSSTTSKPPSSVQTVTVDGTTRTVTLTPTATGDSNSAKPIAVKSGLGGGAIAGIVIGVVAAIALAAFVVWFLLRRHKHDQNDGYRDDPSVRGSSPGRMGSHQHELSLSGSAASPGSAGNRSSMLQVDPRMDPFKQGLYMRNNGSAESVNTLRDEHDYSRRIQQPKVLRATNPDPDT